MPILRKWLGLALVCVLAASLQGVEAKVDLRPVPRPIVLPAASAAKQQTAYHHDQEFDANQHTTHGLYEVWKLHHPELIARYGVPREPPRFIFVADQQFETGWIEYDLTNGKAFLFYGRTGKFRQLPTPPQQLTPGPGLKINEKLLAELLVGVDQKSQLAYRSLIEDRTARGGVGIVGGIATLYIRERLFGDFGKPLGDEVLIRNAAYATAPEYDLLVGLPIGPSGLGSPRNVYVLFRDGHYETNAEDVLTESSWKRFLAWIRSTAGTSSAVTVVLLAWVFCSRRFARTFAKLPGLRFPLELDAYVLKRRSRLVRLYCEELTANVRRQLDDSEVKVVALPLETLAGRRLTTEEWLRGLSEQLKGEGQRAGEGGRRWRAVLRWPWRVSARGNGARRVETKKSGNGSKHAARIAIQGPGGSGKTVLLSTAILTLLAHGRIPILFRAGDFRGEASFEEWMARVFNDFGTPLSTGVAMNIPEVLYVIDQLSEVPVKTSERFWILVLQERERAGGKAVIAAGRTVVPEEMSAEDARRLWTETIRPSLLDDHDILRLAGEYLDPSGHSIELQRIPAEIRRIMPNPTAFVVSHYVRTVRDSVRSVASVSQLFEVILDRHVSRGELAARPAVVRVILQGLVEANFQKLGDRGLPAGDVLITQVASITRDEDLAAKYGSDAVPPAATFVTKLLASGLMYRVGHRFLFFHDAFEDWLANPPEGPRKQVPRKQRPAPSRNRKTRAR